MRPAPLPFRSARSEYEAQADALLEAWRAGDSEATRFFREHHPRFLDERAPWLPRRLSDQDVQGVALDRSDARLATARGYSFRDCVEAAITLLEAGAEPDALAAMYGARCTTLPMLGERGSTSATRSTRARRWAGRSTGGATG